jgi:hypothetical protein
VATSRSRTCRTSFTTVPLVCGGRIRAWAWGGIPSRGLRNRRSLAGRVPEGRSRPEAGLLLLGVREDEDQVRRCGRGGQRMAEDQHGGESKWCTHASRGRWRGGVVASNVTCPDDFLHGRSVAARFGRPRVDGRTSLRTRPRVGGPQAAEAALGGDGIDCSPPAVSTSTRAARARPVEPVSDSYGILRRNSQEYCISPSLNAIECDALQSTRIRISSLHNHALCPQRCPLSSVFGTEGWGFESLRVYLEPQRLASCGSFSLGPCVPLKPGYRSE